MSDAVEAPSDVAAAAPAGRPGRTYLIWALIPLAVLGLAIAWLVSTDPLSGFRNGAPPVEKVTFERTILGSNGVRLLVRAGGSEPMTIAQVQVDDAYWQFAQDPPGPIARGSTAWIQLPFPWVAGEAHAVKLVTNTGTTFDHAIAVAVATPTADSMSFASQAVLGIFGAHALRWVAVQAHLTGVDRGEEVLANEGGKAEGGDEESHEGDEDGGAVGERPVEQAHIAITEAFEKRIEETVHGGKQAAAVVA